MEDRIVDSVIATVEENNELRVELPAAFPVVEIALIPTIFANPQPGAPGSFSTPGPLRTDRFPPPLSPQPSATPQLFDRLQPISFGAEPQGSQPSDGSRASERCAPCSQKRCPPREFGALQNPLGCTFRGVSRPAKLQV